MNQNGIQKAIASGKTALGIELGSTRIKAVLIGEDHTPLAAGSHEWETATKTASGHTASKLSGPACRQAIATSAARC